MTTHSAIHRAVIEDDIGVVMTWLRENPGINPDVVDHNGKSALYIACLYGHSSIARVMLRAGADVNLKCGPGGLTSIHAAACHWGKLRQLVEAGTDLSMRTTEGLPVHDYAVLADSPAVIPT